MTCDPTPSPRAAGTTLSRDALRASCWHPRCPPCPCPPGPDLLAGFFGEGERERLRPALFSRERERDLEREPLELQELLRCPGLGDGLFLRSEACRECLADDSELLLGRPRWCRSFTL